MNISYGYHNDINLKTLVTLSRARQTLFKTEMESIKRTGLSIAQFSVLEALYHLGKMTISEVTKKILSTPGNMTVVINNLIKEGMITKYTNIKDKRASILCITSKGESLIKVFFPDHIKAINTSLNRLNENEKEQLRYLLKKLSGVL